MTAGHSSIPQNRHKGSQLVGVISDTHGLVRPQALDALKGSDLIIHAGDVGKSRVLEDLQALAPVVAVRGNIDGGELARVLPETQMVQVGRVCIFVLHDISHLSSSPSYTLANAVIFGHSHKPLIKEENGILFVNPGSAGPRRFRLPVSVALLHIHDENLQAELIELPLGEV